MRPFRCVFAFATATLVMGMPGTAQEKPEVKLEVVKYDGLKDAVSRNRGKVVLVDFWGFY